MTIRSITEFNNCSIFRSLNRFYVDHTLNLIGTICHFSPEIMVTTTHEQKIINCRSRGRLLANEEEGTNASNDKLCYSTRVQSVLNINCRHSHSFCRLIDRKAGEVHEPAFKEIGQYSLTDRTSQVNKIIIRFRMNLFTVRTLET